MSRRHLPIEQRLWAKVEKTPSCWVWTGYVQNRGYGKIGTGGKRGRMVYVHRVAYEEAYGPIPDGLVIDHLCSNRLCVNPAHLEAVTQNVNNKRAGARVTHCPRGHPYTEANTRWSYRPGGSSRACRECDNARRFRAAS